MKKLKVVQIGAEHDHACDIMKTMLNLPQIFEVVGYAIPDGEKNIHPEFYQNVSLLSVDEALNFPDIDAIIVETSEINLTKYAIEAVKRGVAVHMDKPGGLCLSDFETLINTAKQNNSVLHFGYMYRYNPAVLDLLNDIKLGKLGEIYSVEAQMNCMHTKEKRQWLDKFKGGQMFYLGCHLIDLIFTIMGSPKEVIPLNCSTAIDGVTAEDFGMAVLKYDNGVSFAKTCAVEPCGFMRRQLVVSGSKGSVQLLPFEAYDGDGVYTSVRKSYDNIFDWGSDGEKYRTETFDRYITMMTSFASFVRGEKTNPYTYDYELELYKLLLKCCNMEGK